MHANLFAPQLYDKNRCRANKRLASIGAPMAAEQV